MSAFRSTLLVIPLALGLMVSAGCASKKTIDASSAESIIAGVNKGDTVRITTKNDVVHKFTVTRITNKALYGDSERVVYEDMQKVERVKASKTARAKKEVSEEKEGFWGRLF